MTILTATTRLTFEQTSCFYSLADGFFISNLWFPNLAFYFKFTFQTVGNDIQVQFAHTGDNGLTGFLIGIGFEGWVFFCQFGQSDAHFFLVSFCTWFNGDIDNWFWEFHGFQNDWRIFCTQGIACTSIF